MGSCESNQLSLLPHLVSSFPILSSWITKTAVIVIGGPKSCKKPLISFLNKNSIHNNFAYEDSFKTQAFTDKKDSNLPLTIEDTDHIYFIFHSFSEESPSSNDMLRILFIKQIIEEFSSFCIILAIRQSNFNDNTNRSIIRNRLIFYKKIFTESILAKNMIIIVTKAKANFTKTHANNEIKTFFSTIPIVLSSTLHTTTFSKIMANNNESKRLEILNMIKLKKSINIKQIKYEDSNTVIYKSLGNGKKKTFILVAGKLYYIQNIRTNYFLFLSGDLEGGDRVTEAKPDFELRSMFQISKKGLGYILTHEYYKMALFVTEGYRYKGERILEGHLSIMFKSFFKIVETDNGWIFKSKEFKEYVYVSDDMWNGDYMVKTSKNITSKSYFRIKEVDS